MTLVDSNDRYDRGTLKMPRENIITIWLAGDNAITDVGIMGLL